MRPKDTNPSGGNSELSPLFRDTLSSGERVGDSDRQFSGVDGEHYAIQIIGNLFKGKERLGVKFLCSVTEI